MFAGMTIDRVFFVYSAALGVAVGAILLTVPESRTLSLGPYFWVLIGIALFEAVGVYLRGGIANVMGARVYANAVREIGWFPVHGVAAPGNDTFRFPASLEAFHWHGETFDLPAGAVHLARSEACEHQAFQLGRSVIGLQFHLETTPASARELVAHGRDELVPAPFVQSEAQILGTPLQHYAAINDLMGDVLSYLRAAGD